MVRIRRAYNAFSLCLILTVLVSMVSAFELAPAYATITTDHLNIDSSLNYVMATQASTPSIISCELSSNTITLGQSVHIDGRIDPRVETAQIIYLQYSTDGGSTWNIITEEMSEYEGSYDYSWEPPNVGSYLIQAYWNGNEELEAAESIQRSLDVEKMTSMLACGADPASINIGDSTEITGFLSIFQQNTQNKKITISYRPSGGTWSDIITVSTNNNGWYSYYWAPTVAGTYEVKASWSGDEISTEAENAVTVIVAEASTSESSSISCSATPSSIIIGSSTTISGNLSPTIADVQVTLSYRFSGGTWDDISTVSTSSSGDYSYDWTPTTTGTCEVRVSWSGNEDYTGAEKVTTVSVAETATEEPEVTPEEPSESVPEEPSEENPQEPSQGTKKPSEITCALSSTGIQKSETITITGSLSPAYTGVSITLTFTKPNKSTFTRQVTTTSNGKFSTVYEPDASGTWSVSASWAGDEEYESNASSSIFFTVTESDNTSLVDYFTRPDVIGIILAVISSICGGAAWLTARMRKRELSKLLDQLMKIYAQFKMNSRRCESELYRLRDVALEKLKTGKINESSYDVIKERIDEYLHEIRSQIIDERFGGFPSKLRDDLHSMIKRGEISEKEYGALEKLIDRTTELKESDRAQLRKLLEKWKKDYLKKE